MQLDLSPCFGFFLSVIPSISELFSASVHMTTACPFLSFLVRSGPRWCIMKIGHSTWLHDFRVDFVLIQTVLLMGPPVFLIYLYLSPINNFLLLLKMSGSELLLQISYNNSHNLLGLSLHTSSSSAISKPASCLLIKSWIYKACSGS